MTLTLKLAWRNLWRNRRRTFISLAAMSFGCMALMVSMGLLGGLLEELQKNVTEVLCGDAQVHAREYLAERSVHETLTRAEVDAVVAAARAAGVAAAPRSIGHGLVARAARSAGVELMGVDPAAERAFGGLATRVASGAFLDGKAKQAVLGSKVARVLEARIGDELVVVVQSADGSTGSALLQVTGILQGLGDNVDRTLVLIGAREFDELFATGGAHQIALTTHRRLQAEEVARIARRAAPGADVRSWRELLPQVAAVERVWGVVSWLMAVIFSLAAGLGVLNSMLMAQYERIPELGLLKSLGTTPGRIVSDLFIEALLLGLVSVSAGLALGAAVVHYLHAVGIDIGGADPITIGGVTFSAVWRARWSLSLFVQPGLVTLFTALLASVIPAIRAARLDPVEALSHV